MKMDVKEARTFYDKIYASIDESLQANAYSEVNLSKLFSNLFWPRSERSWCASPQP